MHIVLSDAEERLILNKFARVSRLNDIRDRGKALVRDLKRQIDMLSLLLEPQRLNGELNAKLLVEVVQPVAIVLQNGQSSLPVLDLPRVGVLILSAKLISD